MKRRQWGVAGKILIGANAVGWGYHDQPAITAERFVPDSLSGLCGARLYATGDMGRWHPDGTLEYLGRIVDRAHLMIPGMESAAPAAYIEPRTQDEALLAGIWADVLRVERVGIHDNFFEVGGDSILMMRVVQRLNAITSRRITVMDMFRHPTIEAMAAREMSEASSLVSANLSLDNAHRRKQKIRRMTDRFHAR